MATRKITKTPSRQDKILLQSYRQKLNEIDRLKKECKKLEQRFEREYIEYKPRQKIIPARKDPALLCTFTF